ncbi:MAG: ATP-binding domain-containing protein, partial [Oscillospiraceae bacterium]|nr:ATP-binding domain-containing protein [Oscillospiraceae bacterium]
NGIRYRVFGGFRFFDRAEVKDMLSYLNVINNPGDTLRLQRIVNNPPRGIGAKTLETVAEIAAREGATEFEIMERAAEYPELSRASAKITEFTGMINSLRAFEGPVDELYSEALEKTGYLAMLDLKPGPESDARRENLMELKTSIEQYMRETENATLAGYLDMVSLYTDIDKYDEGDDCVTMMTMHSAKGLEFPTIFVAGAEEGIFPGMRAIGDEEEIEEERRLCYVAITRAKKKLYITGARQRMMMGRTSNNLPSRFVDELPDECIERSEAQRYAPTFGAYGSGDRGARENEGGYGYGRRKRPARPPERPAAPRPAAAPAAVDFRKGDAVEHKAFGKGVILSVQPTGGDALLEIAFDSAGTKRLMAKAASKFMRKG